MTYDKYTYFWNDPPFTQWAYANFKVDGVSYNTAEQFMMAQKAFKFGDSDTFKKIMNVKSPRMQKALGREVKGFNSGVWEAAARDIVYRGNYHKFIQNPEMLNKLKATAGTLLVEASPYDKIWGIGIDVKEAKAGKKWQGTNWLGEVLTVLRDNLESAVDLKAAEFHYF